MVMNLYILILISLPEAILNLYIMLRLSGQNSKINIKDKKSIAKFLLALVLMLCTSIVIRPFSPNVLVNIILHSLAYTVIFWFVYRINMIKSAFCASLVLMLNSAIENLYIPFVVAYISKGYDNFFANYKLFAIYSIPYRIAQICIALWINKYEIVFDMAKINKRFYKIFIVFMYVLILLGFSFALIFYNYFSSMSLFFQVLFSFSISTMVFMTSFLVFNLIYLALTGILTGGYKQYQVLEEEAKLAFNKIYNLLKNRNVTDATTLLEKILEEDITNTNNGGENQ